MTFFFQNNLRINLQRLQNEVEELRKRKATAQIKYEAEKAVSYETVTSDLE